MNKKTTNGGAIVGGEINVGSGKIYPKDHTVYGDKVGGNHSSSKGGVTTNEPTEPADMTGLPASAVLSPDWIGGRMNRGGKTYRLM